MDAQHGTFDSAEREFAALDQQRLAGEISDTTYRERLNSLRVKDEEGHTWMLQERTGQWFVYRAGAWTAGTPPGREASEPPGPPPPPPDLTPPAVEVQRSEATQPDTGGPPDTRTLPPVPAPASESRPMPGVQPTLASVGLPPVPPPTAASSTPQTVYSPPPAAASTYPPPPPPAVAASTYPPPPPPASADFAVHADAAVDADMAEFADTPAPSRKTGRTGKRARSRPAGRARQTRRRGCVGITWSILKWELVWITIAWFVYDVVGDRAPWALAPVGLLAVITLLLWLRRIQPTIPQGA